MKWIFSGIGKINLRNTSFSLIHSSPSRFPFLIFSHLLSPIYVILVKCVQSNQVNKGSNVPLYQLLIKSTLGHTHTLVALKFLCVHTHSHIAAMWEATSHLSILYIRLQILLRGKRLKGEAAVSVNCPASRGFKQNHTLCLNLWIKNK